MISADGVNWGSKVILNEASAFRPGAAITHDIGRSSRPYFRPPYGSHSEQVQYPASGIGLRTIMWSVDPRDWAPNTTVQDILNRVLNSPNLAPGAIILMRINSLNEPEGAGQCCRRIDSARRGRGRRRALPLL